MHKRPLSIFQYSQKTVPKFPDFDIAFFLRCAKKNNLLHKKNVGSVYSNSII